MANYLDYNSLYGERWMGIMRNRFLFILGFVLLMLQAFLFGYYLSPNKKAVASEIKFRDLDGRQCILHLREDGTGYIEQWLLGPDDPLGLKPLTEKEFKELQEEMKKQKKNGL